MNDEKYILDACCGSRMFWFDRMHKNTIYMDNRELEDTLCDGRKLIVKPDVVADFREMPFDDNTFKLVVFDPPHLIKIGETSWMAKKYGKLSENWREDLKQGFSECMRVLKPHGVLIFKWSEQQIKLSDILKLIPYKPLFGDKRSKTHWLVFMKEELTRC
jgi:ubiquinone/menaquinone biosynthesis C-methylase UbiE